MKRIMLALLLLCAFQAPASELITNIQGKTLDQFFIMASDVMGKTIVTSPTIDGDVKIYNIGRAANFRDVFFYVIRANGLAYQENKDIIRVFRKNRLKPEDKITTKVYRLTNVKATSVLDSLNTAFQSYASRLGVPDLFAAQSVLNGRGVMVTAPRSAQNELATLVHSLDYVPQQVLVRAVIFETIDTDMEEINTAFVARMGDASISTEANNGSNLFSELAGVFYNSLDFDAYVKFLSGTERVSVHSKPSLLIKHQKTGKISVGQNLPFVTGSYNDENSDKPFTTIERKDIGLILRVTPYVFNKDKIEVNVYQELSRVDGTVKASDIVTSNRSLQTTLDIRPGTTIMIGGAVSEEKSNMVQKVPVLGDIPLIGALFRSKNDTETTRDLKILLHVELPTS
ncbi:type II secretion system protein GspD [Salinivibrio kushneri]|nr:hypothetical protein [Salinivibrio kushneri]